MYFSMKKNDLRRKERNARNKGKQIIARYRKLTNTQSKGEHKKYFLVWLKSESKILYKSDMVA